MSDISLISPRNGAVVSLSTKAQKEFFSQKIIEEPGEELDWLHLIKTVKEDLSLPRKIRFLWSCPEQLFRTEVQCSEDHELKTGVLVYRASGSASSVIVHSLKTNTLYFWRVAGENAKGKKVVSGVRSFQTEEGHPRWCHVQGVSNVRDCGGWSTNDGHRIRQGLFYRGGELNGHMKVTNKGMDFLCRQLKIHTLLDIRHPKEIKQAGGRPSGLPRRVQWARIQMDPYFRIFTSEAAQQYAKGLRLLADPENLPLYIHCWGGADRTGTFVFMINSLLGVETESLIRDYEITSLSIWGARSRCGNRFREFMEALEKNTKGTELQERAEDYFRRAGIHDDEIAAVRRNFRSPEK